MNDLEKFRSEPVPRTRDLCEPYVRRFVPAFGIAAYGIIYLFFSPLPAILAGFLAFKSLAYISPLTGRLPSWVLALFGVVVLGSYVLGWFPFAWWARRWRASRRRLLREGSLLEAHFTGLSYTRDESGVGTLSHYRFLHNGSGRTTAVGRAGEHFDEPCKTIVVLFHPELSFGARFHEGTIQYVIGWGRDRVPGD